VVGGRNLRFITLNGSEREKGGPDPMKMQKKGGIAQDVAKEKKRSWSPVCNSKGKSATVARQRGRND